MCMDSDSSAGSCSDVRNELIGGTKLFID